MKSLLLIIPYYLLVLGIVSCNSEVDSKSTKTTNPAPFSEDSLNHHSQPENPNNPSYSISDSSMAKMYSDSAKVLYNSAMFKESIIYHKKALNIYEKILNTNDTIIAKRYHHIAEIYLKRDLFDSSLVEAKKAFELTKIFRKGENAIHGFSNNLLGRIWAKKGNYEKALNYYERSLEIKISLLGAKHPSVADTYNNLGNIWMREGDFDKALHYYEKDLEITIPKLGKDHQFVGETYSNMGVSLRAKGEYEKALQYFNEAQKNKIHNYGKFHLSVAKTYNNIGMVWMDKGDLDKAIEFYEKSLEIKLLKKNHLSTAFTYENLGIVWKKKRHFKKALQFFEKALKIKIEKLGLEHISVANNYNNLGALLGEKGDFSKALWYYEKSLKIKLKQLSEDHPEIATTYFNIALIWSDKNEFDKSLELLNRALKSFIKSLGENHENVGRTYNSIGNVLKKKGHYDQALVKYNHALSIHIQNFGSNHPTVAMAFNNIGSTWGKKGDYNKAISNFERSKIILENNYGEVHPLVGQSYNNIGEGWFEKRELNKAYQFFNDALKALGYKTLNSSEFSNVSDLNELRKVFLSFHKYFQKRFNNSKNQKYQDSIKTNCRRMIALEDCFQREYINHSTRQFYSAQSKSVFEAVISAIVSRNNQEELTEAFNLSEMSKSRFLSEKVKSATFRTNFGLPDSIIEKEHQLNLDIAYLKRRKFENNAINDSLESIYKSKIIDLELERDNFLEELRQEHPNYFNLRFKQDVISINGIQDSLLTENNDQTKVLLEYFVGDSNIYAFTILTDTFYISKIKKDFPLGRWVNDMLCGISNTYADNNNGCGLNKESRINNTYQINALKLYQKIFAPIDSIIPKNAEILIVPDGVLGYLPFEILLVEAPSPEQKTNQYPYLLRDHIISYAFSATLQQEMQYREYSSSPSKDLLAFAPSFDNIINIDTSLFSNPFIDVYNLRERLIPLKFNVLEVKSIGKTIGGNVVIGAEATKNSFLQNAQDYKILHLSTHGKVNDLESDYSFLAFYNLNDSIENEILYNIELYNCNFNADLVVLSACETGIGELQKGEGIISLGRAFSYAGTKSIVSSLWQVNEQSTQVLMKLFYENLMQGMSKNKALRSAKLDYLENYTHLGFDPFYWAAFTLNGDISPLEVGYEKRISWWVLGGLFLFVLSYYFTKVKQN